MSASSQRSVKSAQAMKCVTISGRVTWEARQSWLRGPRGLGLYVGFKKMSIGDTGLWGLGFRFYKVIPITGRDLEHSVQIGGRSHR